MSFSKVAVVGAGVMGQGISQTVASIGTEVLLFDVDEEQLKSSLKSLSDEMDHEIERWGMTSSEKKAVLSRIRISSNLDEASDYPLIIEAIPEDLGRKKALFAMLDAVCPPEVIFVTNTSTLSITEIGAATKRPEHLIGLHFLNPVPKIPLVEIVKGIGTTASKSSIVSSFLASFTLTILPFSPLNGPLRISITSPTSSCIEGFSFSRYFLMSAIVTGFLIIPFTCGAP